VITALLVLIAFPIWAPTLFFAVETIVGLFRGSGARTFECRPTTVVVVPACNEAPVIKATVGRLLAALDQNMSLLVIADNCVDETAEQARSAGAEVVERSDPELRGKGFALAFAVAALQSAPPSVLVVVDADCAIDQASLRSLVSCAFETGRPCQAVNLLRASGSDSALVQISTFAFLLKNLVRQRGLQRLAGRVHLTGTGMALPFSLLSHADLANDNIVEDLALGIRMAERGFPPKLVVDALVVSSPASTDDTLVQRRRWEGGFLETSFRYAPHMLADALRRRNYRLLLAALDLMVPPLTLLIILNVITLTIFAGISVAFGLSWLPFFAGLLVLGLAGIAVLLAWAREGRACLNPAVLLRIPLYLLWKIPLYLSLMRRGAPRDWLRTRR